MFTEFHADDYGCFLKQSKEILRCRRDGKLNGISIIPNGFELQESMALLTEEDIRELNIAVHLNLVPGWKPICKDSEISLLTNNDGEFSVSFGKYLLISFLSTKANKSRYINSLKKEILSQIKTVLSFLPSDYKIRIDGHVHYHMLPVVFDALVEALDELSPREVEYIRVPTEQKAVYKEVKSKELQVKPINKIKMIVLNFLANYNQRRHPSVFSKFNNALFSGILFSGDMTIKNAPHVLASLEKIATEHNSDIELLFHPGGLSDQDDQTEVSMIKSGDDKIFFTSPKRAEEAEALLTPYKK